MSGDGVGNRGFVPGEEITAGNVPRQTGGTPPPGVTPLPGGERPVPGETPRVGGVTGSRSMSPFMPGFDRMLAQQLSLGMGGKPESYLEAFHQIFSPMNIPTYGGPESGKMPGEKGGDWTDTRVPGESGRPRTGGTGGSGNIVNMNDRNRRRPADR